MDIISVIKDRYDGLSKGQQLVAGFIVENCDKAAYMSAERLGETVGVSESTVIRFPAEIGFDSYKKFQKALQDLTRARLTPIQRLMGAEEAGDSRIFLSRVLSQNIDMLRRTLNEIDERAFESAVDSLINAKKVYIIGVRSSAPLAQLLGFYLNMLLEDVDVVGGDGIGDMYEHMLCVDRHDAVIAISFPRYSKRTLNALKYAKECEANIIAITDSMLSPLAEFAGTVLLAATDTEYFVDSLVSPLSMVSALAVAVGMKRKDKTADTFSRLEQLWELNDVYNSK